MRANDSIWTGSKLHHDSGNVRDPTVTVIKSEYKSMNVFVESKPLGAVNENYV